MIVKCEICSKSFYKGPVHVKRVKRNFCSNVCKGLGQTGINNPAFKKSWIKICLLCKKKYRYFQSKGKKFCSQKCMGQYKHIAKSKKVNCAICSKPFQIINALLLKENTCSILCKNRLHSRRMSDNGNSNWRGGIGKLPWGYEFTKLLKYKIKRRDNFKCRLCGKENSILFKEKGYGLIIHHIDYDKKNNVPNNLISLCDMCHGKTGHNRKKWKIKLLKILIQ